MNEEEKGVDVTSAAERSSRSWLHGFWKEENNILAHIDGEYRRGVASRSHEYLERLARNRWMLIEEWDQWRFEAEALL